MKMELMKNVLVITDNGLLLKRFQKIVAESGVTARFTYVRSHSSRRAKLYESGISELPVLDVKSSVSDIREKYALVISLHCKQIFPPELVNTVRCINVHPGYNPVNRGWYPQVFAINEGLPIGATIHVMDEGVDTGNIIDRKLVEVRPWDTSKEVYERVLDAEMELVRKNLEAIVEGDYSPCPPETEGRFHTRKDFEELCELDLNEVLTMGQAINRLRALTHGSYKNAWFRDPQSGKMIVVSINLALGES